MSENELALAATNVMRVLEPLAVDERARVIRAALTLLGDVSSGASNLGSPAHGSTSSSDRPAAAEPDLRMRRLGLSVEQLENYLHFENGDATPIGLPGNAQSKREQTKNTYLLAGLAAALSGGDGKFSDSEARSLCVQFGCFDSPNHVRILKTLGNKLTGSKDAGWKLTSPGLNAAAALIKNHS
ncbi:hypothetical protein MQC88_00720 [Luteimonas sp. 50]|uniref:Tellurite resistance protein TerB n=1 Tax=Cognatiluteimonas sedimenti TaxID=2927791 RepID=A0ABT0A0J4_9GAMM|nr:hypothetical protein [Lysobacter sedimenti]MCJ0824493.1 hypothetical protein [Lysobacter sedimenti]